MLITKANAERDIDLINAYTLRELRPDEVFCFSAILCNNLPDRDNERFTDAALRKMAELFPGKPGLIGHEWGGDTSSARVYRAAVEDIEGGLGLRGDVYIPRIPALAELIDKIETGVVKEVSVGVRVASRTCSICGAQMYWDECKEGHIKGQEYDGAACLGLLDDPTDAFEFSFVSVPAQPGAGIIKSLAELSPATALDRLMQPDVVLMADSPEVRKLLGKIDGGARRAEILRNNEKYLKG